MLTRRSFIGRSLAAAVALTLARYLPAQTELSVSSHSYGNHIIVHWSSITGHGSWDFKFNKGEWSEVLPKAKRLEKLLRADGNDVITSLSVEGLP